MFKTAMISAPIFLPHSDPAVAENRVVMSRSDILTKWKGWVRFWAPAGLLDLYRRKRSSHTPPPYAQVSTPKELFVLPQRSLNDLFPGIEATEVRIRADEIYGRDEWALPLPELLTVAVICNHIRPRRIFEIGTYKGSSTLLMAMNTPPQTEIFTLDLDPSERDTHRHGLGVGGFPSFTVGLAYQGTPFTEKIRQLFGNSVAYDYDPFRGTIDLVLIDADHSYDFVKTDTENAFTLLRPGGIIIWDDYSWDERHPECSGVTRSLNELSESRPCYQIAGTRFALYVSKQAESDSAIADLSSS